MYSKLVWVVLYLLNSDLISSPFLVVYSLNLKFNVSLLIFNLIYNKHRKIYKHERVRIWHFLNTESSKYYARIQTAVARGLGLPPGRLAGHHTDAASKLSLCYFSSFSELVTRIDVHLQSGDVSVYWLWLFLYVSAVSVVIVIIVIFEMLRQEFSLFERLYIHNTYI